MVLLHWLLFVQLLVFASQGYPALRGLSRNSWECLRLYFRVIMEAYYDRIYCSLDLLQIVLLSLWVLTLSWTLDFLTSLLQQRISFLSFSGHLVQSLLSLDSVSLFCLLFNCLVSVIHTFQSHRIFGSYVFQKILCHGFMGCALWSLVQNSNLGFGH